MELRHLQFLYFVQTHLQPLQVDCVDDRVAFLAAANPAQVRAIFVLCPLRFAVDNCPVFL